ncbi:MAG: lipoprotein [Gammaproteobacteria bacterium]|nr:lipoprotein [Gammaproteobacteria bacterium]
MRTRRVTTLLGGVALLSLLAACGQTGPLYLPEDDAATVITRPGPATSPAPPSAPAPASPPPEAGGATTPEGADTTRREVPRSGS